MPISPEFDSVFSKNFEINFTQCLPNGSLRFTDLCNILQLTAAAHSEVGGISFSDMQEFQQAWVLSKMRVEIRNLPKWKDVITIKTWINSFKESRSVRALELYLDGEKIVGCETFWVVLNTSKRKPEALALPFAHFELYPDRQATVSPFSRINLDHEKEVISNKIVVLSDLDIVDHVNNVKYLEWCLDLVDPNLLLDQKVGSFEMNFLKELSLADEVSIHENKKSHEQIYYITKEDKICFGLQLNLK
jgi:medium-chain acyl-[acyl-carrier-protein] hydrolase